MVERIYVERCAIWYHLYNLNNVKNTHGGVLILVKLTKINTSPWVFFTFFKLYKCYQIAQRTTYMDSMGEAVYFIFPNYENLMVGDFNAQEAFFHVKDFCDMTVLSISLKNLHAIRIL